MWILLATIAVLLIIFLVDGLPLLKKRQKKDFWIFATFLMIGAGFWIYQNTGNEIPTPLYWIKVWLEPLTRPFYSLFK